MARAWRRRAVRLGSLGVVLLWVWVSPAASEAQLGADVPPRTPWGAPDLQGIWDFRTTTPLQRPEAESSTVLTNEAAADFAQQQRETTAARLARDLNADWIDRFDVGLADGRTALITDPPDGRIPVRQSVLDRRVARQAQRVRVHGAEDRDFIERCIVRQSPPLTVFAYNNHIQVFQTPDTVAILHEMIHEAVIVPLDGRPHAPFTIRLWQGDARGHWEGDTLVVETTNRHHLWSHPRWLPPTPNLLVVERFRRVDRDTLHYEYTVSDSESFTSDWSVAIPMRRTAGPLYEYACHEGNQSLPLILSGARAADVVNDGGSR